MGRGSGSTRNGSAPSRSSGLAAGGTVASWPEMQNKRDEMRSSLRQFAEDNDLIENSGYEFTHYFNEGDNVRSYVIEVESNPTFDQNGNVVNYTVVYRTKVNDYRYANPSQNRRYWRLHGEADKYFTDINKAYKHIDDITRKMNRIKLN